MNIPIDLIFEGKTVAKILSFTYETPWASGNVVFESRSLFEKMVAVSSMSSFDLEMDNLELEDDEEEKMWEEKLSDLGISWDDLKLDDDKWSIVPSGSEPRPIYSPRFDESGFMEWRQ